MLYRCIFATLNWAAVKVVEGFDWNLVGRLYKAPA